MEQDEERNPLDAIVESLSHSKEWKDGFEAGILYVLMSGQIPYIAGKCARTNEELVFAFARRCGYTWTWQPLPGNEQSMVTFKLPGTGDDDDDGTDC